MLDQIALDKPLVALPLVFFGGVLTSLTPCIYPMIPITAAVVGGTTAGSAAAHPRRRALLLSLVYAMGLALVYGALGLVAGLTGTMFGTVSSNPWAYFTIANLLVIAALAMMDVLPVRVPSALLQRAATAGTGGAWRARS